ncbi:undecaprenyl-diphosphatase [Peribacillus glennii]|uniref:Undecaprenyl-diphosphatase n=1 Tax=Peribacillus glennii TaxID=2303991 RepID=A0A372LGS3_9BACI|nr:undecaprenyl-diphosphatase [Peribacillus glennii]RFU65279.1 undecaprenyl-diphosphatase [Peribacillus glennii]
MNITNLNIEFFRSINDFGKQHPYLNPPLVFIAEYMVYLLCAVVVIYWFTRIDNYRMMVMSALFAFVLAEVIGKAAGKLHSNNQPFAELPDVNQLIEKAVDNSFPSDHTILFFTFCSSFWLFGKRLGSFWVILAFCVGVSRIWAGVHYPADILAGAIIGFISAYIAYLLVTRLRFAKKILAFYLKYENKIMPQSAKSKNF